MKTLPLLLLLICCTLPARADSGTLTPRDHETPDPSILSLDEMRVDIAIDNGDAHVSIVQIFTNHTKDIQEGTYRFALPGAATVSDFAVWDEPVRIPAVILERKRAEQVYDQARLQAVDPGLLEAGERDNKDPAPRRSSRQRSFPFPLTAPNASRLSITSAFPPPTSNNTSRSRSSPMPASSKAPAVLPSTLSFTLPIPSNLSPRHRRVSPSRSPPTMRIPSKARCAPIISHSTTTLPPPGYSRRQTRTNSPLSCTAILTCRCPPPANRSRRSARPPRNQAFSRRKSCSPIPGARVSRIRLSPSHPARSSCSSTTPSPCSGRSWNAVTRRSKPRCIPSNRRTASTSFSSIRT